MKRTDIGIGHATGDHIAQCLVDDSQRFTNLGFGQRQRRGEFEHVAARAA